MDEVPKELTKEELTDTLKRVQADFVNFRRRTEEEIKVIRKRANEDIIKDVLAIADNLAMAIKQVPKDQHTEFYKGVTLIQKQLTSLLDSQGIEKIPHEKFDANMHEALLTEESEKPQGAIIEVLQQGYLLAGKVLRPSKVKVSSGGKKQ